MNILYDLTLTVPELSTHLPTSSWAFWNAYTWEWLMGCRLIWRAAKFAQYTVVFEAPVSTSSHSDLDKSELFML